MRKVYKLLLIGFGVLFLFLFHLQFIIPVIYLSIGLTLYFIFFMWAKIRELDNNYEEWNYVLNSTRGMIYFIFTGCFLWLPVLIPLLKEFNDKKIKKHEKISVWIEYIKNPMKLHQDWFNHFYQ